MFDKVLHHKLLREGLEGEGVITGQDVEGAKGELGVLGFYVGIKGHIRFDDGTAVGFSSKHLDTSQLGDLDVGTIVPLRYSADLQHVVLDVLKLEAKHAAKRQAVAEWAEHRKQEEIAAADAKIAQTNRRHHQD